MPTAPPPERLLDAARAAFPAARAVVFTGSVVMRMAPIKADIDIIALTPEVSPGTVIDIEALIDGSPVTITGYNPGHFLAVARDPDLLFFHLREARKLAFGVTLADDGIAESNVRALLGARVSSSRLRALIQPADAYLAVKRGQRYDLTFFIALEALIFATMHARIDTVYSKHKYLLEDARRLDWSSLATLIERSAEPLVAGSRWPDLLGTLEAYVDGRSTPDAGLACIVADARALVAAGHGLAAVFPFRHALLRLVSRREAQFAEPCPSFNALLQRGFCLGASVPWDTLKLFLACRRETNAVIATAC